MMWNKLTHRSVDLLLEQVKARPELVERIKTDPVATLEALSTEVKRANPPLRPTEDKFTYRLAVIALTLVVLCVILTVAVAWILSGNPATDFRVPDILLAMGSTALGALAGLLVPGGATTR